MKFSITEIYQIVTLIALLWGVLAPIFAYYRDPHHLPKNIAGLLSDSTGIAIITDAIKQTAKIEGMTPAQRMETASNIIKANLATELEQFVDTSTANALVNLIYVKLKQQGIVP